MIEFVNALSAQAPTPPAEPPASSGGMHLVGLAILVVEIAVIGKAIHEKWNSPGAKLWPLLVMYQLLIPVLIPWWALSLLSAAMVSDSKRVASRTVRWHVAFRSDVPAFVTTAALEAGPLPDRLDARWRVFRAATVPEWIFRGVWWVLDRPAVRTRLLALRARLTAVRPWAVGRWAAGWRWAAEAWAVTGGRVPSLLRRGRAAVEVDEDQGDDDERAPLTVGQAYELQVGRVEGE